MAQFDFYELKDEYEDFTRPYVEVFVNDKNINDTKDYSIGISDVDIELTSGFEASIATFVLYNVYDNDIHLFLYDNFKPYVALGSSVVINMGYNINVREVFRGFISRVRFIYARDDTPGVEITAMDIKGIMMANNNSRQLKGNTYKEAVEEIFSLPCYQSLSSNSIVTDVNVDNTPDMQSDGGGGGDAGGGGGGGNNATDKSIEMVAESDYEFVVKAAKKFNFEFFSVAGVVLFREAKKIKDSLIVIDSGALLNGLDSYSVEYDITGLVEQIEVRGVDVGKNRMINSAKKKLTNKLSFGSKAKSLVKGQKKIYIDPTIHSKEEANFRANYLAETIAYRLGTLEATFKGLPELAPGFFIEFMGFGTGVDNKFYITNVRHNMDGFGIFTTTVKASAASVDGSAEQSGSK